MIPCLTYLQAPANVSYLGACSRVWATAVAINQRIKVKIQPSQTGLWLLDGGDLNFTRNPHIAGLIDRLWADDETLQPLSFQIEGNIPRASGLGSSAALSTATAAALRMAKGRWLNAKGDGSNNNQWSEGYSSSIKETNPYTGSGYRENREEQYAKKEFHLTGPKAVDIDECALLAHSVEADAQNGRASLWIHQPVHTVESLLSLISGRQILTGNIRAK